MTVHISGCKALPAEVYLDIIRLPPSTRSNAQTALEVRRQVLAYLLRTGFELASVNASVTQNGIEVEVNEGQIERVLFLGPLSFQQIRFKVALSLPADVFNRPLLDRQVRELSESMNMPGIRWELVRSAEVKHVGPQVTKLPPQMAIELMGDPVIRERRPYEVHIIFPEQTGNGLGIELRSGYIDGLESGLNLSKSGLLFDGDRAYVGATGGVGIRARIDTGKLYAHFSRAAVNLHYDLFKLKGHLRPGIWMQDEEIERQRPDLGLENYHALILAAATQMDLELRPGLRFDVGVGFEWRRLWGFETDPGIPLSPQVGLVDRKRPFIRITHESVFNPNVLRWDHRHTIESELRWYLPVGQQPSFAWVNLNYQLVQQFGWHDLYIRARAYAAWGDVTFHDELSVGELTSGLFGNMFVPIGGNVFTEFRFSLTRDVLKIGLFNNASLVAIHAVSGEPALASMVIDAFGPGVHFLAQDMFQLDFYMAFGFRQPGLFGAAFTMVLQKAF